MGSDELNEQTAAFEAGYDAALGYVLESLREELEAAVEDDEVHTEDVLQGVIDELESLLEEVN
jgi:hypothetical protein